MSDRNTIRLISPCLYTVTGSYEQPTAVEVVAGAEAARIVDGKVQLLAASTPYQSELFAKQASLAPMSGILALYGHHDCIEELSRLRGLARQEKAMFAHVEYTVNVGAISGQLVDRNAIRTGGANLRFVNLRRTTQALQFELLDAFKALIAAEGGDPERDMERIVQMATRPDLVPKVLDADPDFKHISVFVTSVADNPASPNKLRQVAFVRPGAQILTSEVIQGSDLADVMFPRWLTNASDFPEVAEHAAI